MNLLTMNFAQYEERKKKNLPNLFFLSVKILEYNDSSPILNQIFVTRKAFLDITFQNMMTSAFRAKPVLYSGQETEHAVPVLSTSHSQLLRQYWQQLNSDLRAMKLTILVHSWSVARSWDKAFTVSVRAYIIISFFSFKHWNFIVSLSLFSNILSGSAFSFMDAHAGTRAGRVRGLGLRWGHYLQRSCTGCQRQCLHFLSHYCE